MYTQYTHKPDWQSVGDYAVYHGSVGDPKNSDPLTNVYGTWGWKIIDEIKPAENESSVHKYRIDRFVGTNFDNILRTNHIRTLVSSGIALELGIGATARTALLKDYFVVIPRDAVSGRQQDLIDETMRWQERCVIVKNADEIVGVWEHSGRAE